MDDTSTLEHPARIREIPVRVSLTGDASDTTDTSKTKMDIRYYH